MKLLRKQPKWLVILLVLVICFSVIRVTLSAYAIVTFNPMNAASSFGFFTLRSIYANDYMIVYSARTANGFHSFNRNLTEDNIGNLLINSNIHQGEMRLILIQGDIIHAIDLSEPTFHSTIDLGMSVFNPGVLRLRLEFTNAVGVRVEIIWGAS